MSKFYQKKKRRKRLRIAFLVLLVLGVVAYYFGNRFAISKGYDGLWSLITTSSANYSGSIPADMVMEIKIKQDHFTKLEKVREDALKRGVIIQPEDPYVPCKIHFNGKIHRTTAPSRSNRKARWRFF